MSSLLEKTSKKTSSQEVSNKDARIVHNHLFHLLLAGQPTERQRNGGLPDSPDGVLYWH